MLERELSLRSRNSPVNEEGDDDDESKTRKHISFATRATNHIAKIGLLWPCVIFFLFLLIVSILLHTRNLACVPSSSSPFYSRFNFFGIDGLDSDFGILGVPWCRPKHGNTVEWTNKDLIKGLEEFVPIYETRPIKNNMYGMGFDHSFGLWFIARWIKPELMIESGAFKGHSTWVLRQAMPETRILSITPRHPEKYLKKGAAYVDGNCTYFAGKDFVDFGSVDWKSVLKKHKVTDRSQVLVFFDDHQNELKRLKQALKAGFRHLVFEDNYDTGTGDHYSFRQICDQFYIRDCGSLGTTFDLVAYTNVTRNNCKGTPTLAFYFRSFLSTPVKLSLEKRRWSTPPTKSIVHTLAADAYRVANEEPASAVPHEYSAGKSNCLDNVIVNSEATPWTAETSVNFNVKPKRRRPSRKSEMPPVKIEELVPGASFTGKVRSIQPFGAFVDIGAFTEGLIHISNLSDGFVKDVKSIVSIGQEVKVNVVKVNVEAGQISLTMRESHVSGDLQQKKGSSSGVRINKKISKFVKGQELEVAVKNLRRGESVINLPEREEGSLPKSKESVEDSVNVMGSSLMHVSQEVRPGVSHVATEQVSEVPPVKTEELVRGASFTGRVRSIQPFGAFVDIGAFTEGLVHISNMSDGFVTDIKNIVSIGQEVRVKVLETNVERSRISLTMRESCDTNDLLQRRDSSSGDTTDKPLPATKNIARTKKKNSKFVKGQELEGTVKSLNRGGSVISLPEGEEGFLPRSEESVEGIVNVMGGSSLQVGQEITVRVLHVAKGQVTLTMKKGDDVKKQVPEVIHIGVVHEATNPFALAFLKNKDIAKFLDERENMQRLAESS